LLLASDFIDIDRLTDLVRACAGRFDLTALLLRDPWYDGLPLEGFARLRDAETGRTASVFVNRRGRERYRAATVARQASTLSALRRAGARLGVLAEGESPETVLARAFAFV
jgi:hypothetical protein